MQKEHILQKSSVFLRKNDGIHFFCNDSNDRFHEVISFNALFTLQ